MTESNKKKDPNAVSLGRKGGKKGGKARAKKLSKDERTAIAKKAAESRWGAVATHMGELEIGESTLDCAVLEDGRRVLSLRGVGRALQRTSGGRDYRLRNEAEHPLPVWVSQPRVAPFVSPELAEKLTKPIAYRMPQGGLAYGVEASLLTDICDVWLKARQAGVLHPTQLATAQRAEILVRGLAQTGIIALVDEATGYQFQRARNALAEILEAFCTRELAQWAKTFPDEYYVQLFRLKGKNVRLLSTKKPQWMGSVTNNLVYQRLAPGVLEELRRLNPKNEKGRRRARHHQYLTRDVGHPKLKEHIAQLIVLMRASVDWDMFKMLLERSLPRMGDNLILPSVE